MLERVPTKKELKKLSKDKTDKLKKVYLLCLSKPGDSAAD